MADIVNVAGERLASGALCIGIGARLIRTPEVVRLMRGAGFHWLFLDLEHGSMSIDTAAQLAIAALDSGLTPFARVPRGQHAMATRLLDNGVLGIVWPQVESADEAREIVERLKYPPVGTRSISSSVPQFDYRTPPGTTLTTTLNAVSMTVAMIETPAGLREVEAIAAVPGIDLLLIGTNDLCASLGIPGQFDHPSIDQAYRRVIEACRRHGKQVGMGGIRSRALMRRHIEAGVRFVLAGSDASLLAQAAHDEAASLMALIAPGA
jgi:4-hydroxy-2-oxoheptanedioate aldolase